MSVAVRGARFFRTERFMLVSSLARLFEAEESKRHALRARHLRRSEAEDLSKSSTGVSRGTGRNPPESSRHSDRVVIAPLDHQEPRGQQSEPEGRRPEPIAPAAHQ